MPLTLWQNTLQYLHLMLYIIVLVWYCFFYAFYKTWYIHFFQYLCLYIDIFAKNSSLYYINIFSLISSSSYFFYYFSFSAMKYLWTKCYRIFATHLVYDKLCIPVIFLYRPSFNYFFSWQNILVWYKKWGYFHLNTRRFLKLCI